ncbi:uncharacterized protein LOC18034270 [Citrus clementina]|nr:uncharacterized protein LOC18034270 [Citrus x clementina]
MEALSRISFLSNYTRSYFPIFSPLPQTQKPLSKKTSPSSLLRTSTRPVSEVAEEDILQMFFKDRELNGDFISKASDIFNLSSCPLWWCRSMIISNISGLWSIFVSTVRDSWSLLSSDFGVIESDNDDGFLKLSKTREWLLGDNSAPINKKPSAKALQDDSERRKRLNFLKYEALKSELMLLSVGIGTAYSGYCLIMLSVQVAFSYMVGVLFSCLYLQLLYQHADRLSKDMVPQIFMRKKSKKIGIRSEDLKDFLERSIKGSSLALSSPRLVIPVTIYGLWVLSHRYLANDFFDFQIVPAMVGMFVYKAAALVQVYRDNEDLQLVFPENEEGSSD